MNPEKVTHYSEAIERVRRIWGGNLPRPEEINNYRYLTENPPMPEFGLHAKPHVAKMLVLNRLAGGLAVAVYQAGYNQEVVDLSSVEHDRLRLSDGYDLWHGVRSARDMIKRLSQTVEPQVLKQAGEICLWHVWPDRLTPRNLRRTWEWKIFMDTDALDRTRNGQPHDYGDLNANYLRLQTSFLLVDIARELSARTHTQMNQGKDAFSAAIEAGIDLGIVTRV